MKQFQNEYKAVVRLLSRTLGVSPNKIHQVHLNLYSDSSKQGKGDNNTEKPVKGSTSSSNPNSGSTDGPNGKRNDNDDKIKSLLTKTIMWMFTIYMFVAFISLIMTPRSERPEVRKLKIKSV